MKPQEQGPTGQGPHQPQGLRQEAEQRLRASRPADLAALENQDLRVLIHELEVHQIELQVQNEDLRQTQEELTEARNRYEELYEYAPVAYLTLDAQGVIQRANLTAEQVCGMDRSQLVGRRIEQLLVSEDRDRCYVFLRETAATSERRAQELRLGCRKDEARWADVTASVLGGPGAAYGFRVTLSDVTERKQAEQALQQREQQLQELAATLEQRVVERTMQLQALAVQLSQAEQRERHRLAKVLHDHLQQLLVGAKFQLSSLRSDLTDDVLLESAGRVDDLLDESVKVSRSLTAELSPPILYHGGMRNIFEWLARWMREKHGLAVHVDVDEAADEQAEEVRVLIFGAVRELLLNVVKHANVLAATIQMSREEDGLARVLVADKGDGFDAAHVQPGDHQGGFGLLNLRERLAALGGRVEVESGQGDGTRVTLVVPTALGRAAAEAAATHAEIAEVVGACPAGGAGGDGVAGQAGAVRAAAVRRRIRVLLADDHAVVRDGLARMLLVQPGIEVVGTASSGIEARDLALQLEPDVVVMDVGMPGLSGMEATRQILAQLPETRVIGLSMHQESRIAAAMREAGAVAYMAKTSPPDMLIGMIRRAAAG